MSNISNEPNSKERFKAIVLELLKTNHQYMLEKLDDILDNDKVNLEEWDGLYGLTKDFAIALLERSAKQWQPYGGCGNSTIRKSKKNVKHFNQLMSPF